ncbi:MAG: bifunctional diguanylate cyclase/phosphodiesterase [Lachnospiraceae bacterium]|nr:bifunctional diguanylate cyclase/phosphodiesterase [Lachnospiraceae bacterium]
MWIYYIIISLLVVAVVFAFYRMDLYRAYDKHHKREVDKLERELSKERETTTKAINELNEIAYTNPITKLGNIDYFISKTEAMFKQSPHVHYTIVAFNIMNIGKINQLFGPTEGDNVILYAAEVLKEVARRRHHLHAQIYSNLFGLMIKEESDEIVMEQVNAITKKLKEYNENVQIESSFGIYQTTNTDQPVMEMVNACMLAQKFVKDPAVCNYVFYTEELEKDFRENKKMSDEMVEAMNNHKFLMYLQPMVDFHTFKVISAEALVRWDYPGRGILSPYQFIPVFEGTNLVRKLDYYMWEECCRTIRRWIDNKIQPTPIAMNISPIHFQSHGFVEHLNKLCSHYLIDKNLLILEIPERVFSGNTKNLKETIQELKDNGFTLCIDNFGSMNSPLNLFRDYPIDRVKIDRSFLSKNSESEDGMAILRYLIAMAKEVNMMVITEGVETLEQTNFLNEIGSDVGQGYFFSKPVSLREFDQLSRSMVKKVYQSNAYYPTFEDLEKDLDLIAFMIDQGS